MSEDDNPRGRCYCGAWLPPGDEDDGITCSNCYETFDPEKLRLNDFEWIEGEWIHDPEQAHE